MLYVGGRSWQWNDILNKKPKKVLLLQEQRGKGDGHYKKNNMTNTNIVRLCNLTNQCVII